MKEILQELFQLTSFFINHIVFFNIIFSILVIFFQRKEPKSTWAWLLLLYFLPFFGFIIYLLAGTDMHKRKMFRIKEMEDRINDAIRKQESTIRSSKLEKLKPELMGYSDLLYYNLESSGAVLSDDNKVEIFTDGNEKFSALMEDMRNAKEFIHLQYYIIKKDLLFDQIIEILLEKVAEGVEVRILFDSMGCRTVRNKVWKDLNKKGIETAEFFPAILGRFQLRLNYRNHRKIVIIDNKIGYLGGFNIGKEYIGLVKRFGYWRDTHMRIQGTSVLSLHLRFILDWNYASRKKIVMNEKYFNLDITHAGDTDVQIISSGPDSTLQNIRNNYLRLIAKAQKAIYIQTPYFIPDEAMLHALMIAACSGIEVNIMIPCKPDHLFVYWATYSYIGDLVAVGANCYTYDNGFLHAKGMIVDDKAYCYGTANMDIRSFTLNFEVNAIIYGEEETLQMIDIFREDLKHCTQITKEIYNKRSMVIRIKEQICRLLSPVL